jgi:hypothetical protein
MAATSAGTLTDASKRSDAFTGGLVNDGRMNWAIRNVSASPITAYLRFFGIVVSY